MLLNELTQGPLADEIAPFITTGDHGIINDILHRRDIPAKCALPTTEIKKYLSLVDLRLPIKQSESWPCKLATQALEDFNQFDLFDAMILAKFTSILDGLIADETLSPRFTNTDKAMLLAMADTLISRADQIPDLAINIITIADALKGLV